MKSIKHVNVGTVGHVDHGRMLQYTGRRNYLNIAGDWSGDQQYIRGIRNPFEPECIYWSNGLVYVGGRIIHDLTCRVTTIETIIDDAVPTSDQLGHYMASRYKGKFFWALEETVGKPLDIEKLVMQDVYMRDVFFVSNNEKLLNSDRRSVIPTRKAIAWAFQLLYWNDDLMKKMAGVTDGVVPQVDPSFPVFPGSRLDKLTDEGKWDA
jgi:hypothetical protein